MHGYGTSSNPTFIASYFCTYCWLFVKSNIYWIIKHLFCFVGETFNPKVRMRHGFVHCIISIFVLITSCKKPSCAKDEDCSYGCPEDFNGKCTAKCVGSGKLLNQTRTAGLGSGVRLKYPPLFCGKIGDIVNRGIGCNVFMDIPILGVGMDEYFNIITWTWRENCVLILT